MNKTTPSLFNLPAEIKELILEFVFYDLGRDNCCHTEKIEDQGLLKWAEKQQFGENAEQYNGPLLPREGIISASRWWRKFCLEIIFRQESYPPIRIRKQLRLNMRESNTEWPELPLGLAPYWRSVMLNVSLPWTGQGNEIVELAKLLSHFQSVHTLHLNIYLRAQEYVHATRARYYDWVHVILAMC
jgi:hypothetical protein